MTTRVRIENKGPGRVVVRDTHGGSRTLEKDEAHEDYVHPGRSYEVAEEIPEPKPEG